MDYPQEFSPEARARVEAERLRATRAYEKKRNDLPSGYGHFSENEQNFRTFILRVFLAFAHEACELANHGIWTVDEVRSEADEFLRRFTIDAHYYYGQDRSGQKLPKMTSDWGHLRSEVERAFRNTDEWHEYEDKLLSVAEKIAKRSARGSKTEATPANKTKRSEIDAFIAKLADHGHKITRKNIWTVAGYRNRTEFERFQRGHSTNQNAISIFNRVLKMTPDQFLQVLEKNKPK